MKKNIILLTVMAAVVAYFVLKGFSPEANTRLATDSLANQVGQTQTQRISDHTDSDLADSPAEFGSIPKLNNSLTANDYAEKTSKIGEPTKVVFRDVVDYLIRDTKGIEDVLVKNGRPFEANLFALKNLPLGADVSFKVDDIEVSGKVAKNDASKTIAGNNAMRIDIPGDGQFISMYFDNTEKVIIGKIHSYQGSIVFNQNAHTAYFMPFIEYKRMKNALLPH